MVLEFTDLQVYTNSNNLHSPSNFETIRQTKATTRVALVKLALVNFEHFWGYLYLYKPLLPNRPEVLNDLPR